MHSGKNEDATLDATNALALIVEAEVSALNALSVATQSAKAFADAKDKGIHAIDEHVEKVVKPRIDQYVVTAVTGAMQA